MTATAPVETNIGVFHEAIELSAIAPSKTNPRKHFDEAELNELAQSIKDKGVIQPIVIRLNTGGKPKWELVAGERRWRASKIAGAGSIPAIARNLDDRAVLEIQVIENLQRADVHELEEAVGYKQLMDVHGYTVDVLAEKVGKSKEYVYGRLKLTDLIEPLQGKFLERQITAGHAILFARLPENSQITAAKELFESEINPVTGKQERVAMSVRELAAWIARNVQMDLSKAAFDTGDADLVRQAGACIACPKRTGAEPHLWPELGKKDLCTDRPCYERKVDAFIKAEVSSGRMLAMSSEYTDSRRPKGAIGRHSPDVRTVKDGGKCEFMKPAIMVDGFEKGEVLQICCSRSCKKHFASNPRTTKSPKDLAADRLRKQKRETEAKYRRAVYDAIEPKVAAKKAYDGLPMWLVAEAVFDRLEHAQREAMVKELSIFQEKNDYNNKGVRTYLRSCEPSILWLVIVKMIARRNLGVSEWAHDFSNGAEDLIELAKFYGVDHKKIAATVKKEMQTSAKPAAKKQSTKKGK